MTVARRTSATATPERVRAAVAAALDTKAGELKVLHLAPVTSFVDYFVIASGSSGRQVQAIADAVEERLRAAGDRPLHVEGYAAAQWILLDFGDFLVHVFLDERRGYYNLERLWRDAPDRTAEFAA